MNVEKWKNEKSSERQTGEWWTYPCVVLSGIHLWFESRFSLKQHLLLLFLDSDLIGEKRLGLLHKYYFRWSQ